MGIEATAKTSCQQLQLSPNIKKELVEVTVALR